MKRLLKIAAIASALSANAQIGYQVSLLDNATGEPRADETVTVEIAITDSNGKAICSERKSAITNDFGVLSLTVGNSSTFTDADWSTPAFLHLSHCRRHSDWPQPDSQRASGRIRETDRRID